MLDVRLVKNLDELKVRKLEYKPRIEIAQELAIENVFKHQGLVVIERDNENMYLENSDMANHV